MCSLKDGVDDNNWMRMKEVLCTSDDAFDHRIIMNDESSGSHKKEGIIGSAPRFGTGRSTRGYFTTHPCGQMGVDKLADIDDEEFDIPPLFDDTEYEGEEIPDLDRDESDEHVYVGKVFGNKEDYQISLAIYEIKKQISFKQTGTKRDYFTLSCPNERCDWRIKAQDEPDTGNYEIKQAKLEQICDIETRNGTKKR